MLINELGTEIGYNLTRDNILYDDTKHLVNQYILQKFDCKIHTYEHLDDIHCIFKAQTNYQIFGEQRNYLFIIEAGERRLGNRTVEMFPKIFNKINSHFIHKHNIYSIIFLNCSMTELSAVCAMSVDKFRTSLISKLERNEGSHYWFMDEGEVVDLYGDIL